MLLVLIWSVLWMCMDVCLPYYPSLFNLPSIHPWDTLSPVSNLLLFHTSYACAGRDVTTPDHWSWGLEAEAGDQVEKELHKEQPWTPSHSSRQVSKLSGSLIQPCFFLKLNHFDYCNSKQAWNCHMLQLSLEWVSRQWGLCLCSSTGLAR